VEAWIDANLTEPIGLEEIATASGVNVPSLKRTFQRVRLRLSIRHRRRVNPSWFAPSDLC
jgi:hypothetical protein